MRGAYIITAFGALTTLWLLMLLAGTGGGPVMKGLLAVGGLLTAVYTAFLFAQARGRDLWQSPLLPVHMLVQSAVTGTAAAVLLGLLAEEALWEELLPALAAGLVVHLALLLIEFNLPHVTGDTAAAMAAITRGPLRLPFWSAVGAGNVLPLLMLWVSGNGLLVLPACALVLIFALVIEHVWVRAPQLVPLR